MRGSERRTQHARHLAQRLQRDGNPRRAEKLIETIGHCFFATGSVPRAKHGTGRGPRFVDVMAPVGRRRSRVVPLQGEAG